MPKRDFGNATQLGNGSWRIRWPRLDDPTKRHQESGFPTRELAEARLAQIRLERANERVYGAKAKIEPMTVEQYVPKFLDRLRRVDAEENTTRSYEIALRAVCLVCGGETLHQITKERALRIRERLRVGAKGPVCAQTTNDRIDKFGAMYRAAIEEGHALENPFRGMRKLPVKKREFDLMGYPDRAQYLDALRPELRAAAEFTMETALRQSELFRMKKADVFIAERRVLVRKRKNKKPLWSGLTTPALAIIQKQMAENEGDFVWPWRHRSDGFANLWNQSRKRLIKLGMEPLWPHAWRHICAATHAQGQAGVVEIARILGVTVQTAQRYMDHAPGNWIDRGVDRLEKMREQQKRGEAG